jgi:hypothetical protein
MLDKSTILTGVLPFQSYPSANFQLWYQISQNSKNPIKNRLDILKENLIPYKMMYVWLHKNIAEKHKLDRKTTFYLKQIWRKTCPIISTDLIK